MTNFTFSNCPRISRTIALFLLLMATNATTINASAQNSADEYELRAAMLFNICRFITWPASKTDTAQGDFSFCVLDSDPFGLYLDRVITHQTLDGKTATLRRLHSPDEAASCRVLYTSSQDRKRLIKAADILQKNAVLTVAEDADVANAAQVIGLPAVNDHVHIDINLTNAQKSGLNISSRLLQLATVRQ